MRKQLSILILLFFSISTANAQVNDWYHKDEKADGVRGISTYEAYKWLGNRAAKDTIIVAVIDSGIDEEHPDLQKMMWKNPKEIAANGIDEDQNGYVDDVFGWSFLGNKDGRNVSADTYEITREVLRLRAYYAENEVTENNRAEYMKFKEMEEEVERKQEEFTAQYEQIKGFYSAAKTANETLKAHLSVEEVDITQLDNIKTNGDMRLETAVRIFKVLKDNGMNMIDLTEYHDYFEARALYAYNTEFDPREIIGDDINNLNEIGYGNSDVTGPDAGHGTHVAGIIGAERNNNMGIDGIARAVKIIGVRTVPAGDERDKDVANAIRYAVDNGARIINMSFGKGYSPQKEAVDAAVKYAESKNVLLIHGAGNDGKDIDVGENFPTDTFLDGTQPNNWIEVGASGEMPKFTADFSNYGQNTVDIFAPGVDIYSTVPNNRYKSNNGTSMAAPMVAGVAALVLSYYPNLTAAQLKSIILDSAVRYTDEMVALPGSETAQVKFGTLSTTGGLLNALTALKLAKVRN